MSYQIGQVSQANGQMTQISGSYPPFEDINGMKNAHSTPQIYSAVYSAVDVYEMEVNGIAVMRRRKDSWLNATQILKVAGIEKGKRTKVLEKEILIGEHEKVQGGYGKYQGTWIKFERGVEFCRQYGVEELLRPLLIYDMGQDGGVAGGGIIDTPTKEQAMAAQRKRLYSSSTEGKSSAPTGTFFKNISSTASHAVAAITKARFDSPAPRGRKNGINSHSRGFSRQQSQQHLISPDMELNGGSEQNVHSFMPADGFNPSQNNQPYQAPCAHPMRDEVHNSFDELPNKRIKPSPSMNTSQLSVNDRNTGVSIQEISPIEPNKSLICQSQYIHQVDSVCLSLPPIQVPPNSCTTAKQDLLMSLFAKHVQIDYSQHKVFQTFTPEDLDTPIDGSSNTALIWAATLARVELLRNLIAHGASIFRVNSSGETALMRSCLVTNNSEMGTFPEILELLGPTIEIQDSLGRTVLHHITIASAVKGRSQASKYYLESLLEFIVRSSTGPNNQQLQVDDQQIPRSMSIGRFMSEIVNIQDRNGDTALMTAARVGNKSIISQLIEVGADVSIPNRSQLAPGDFGVGNGMEPPYQGRHSSAFARLEPRENSKDIVSSITTLLTETQQEFATEISRKQDIINELHTKLRSETEVLGQRRRVYETLKSGQQKIDTCNLKIKNLARALDEEQARLSQMKEQHNLMPAENVVELGDADEPFRIPENTITALSKVDLNNEQNLDEERTKLKEYASTLPTILVLKSRINAYTKVNESLESSVKDLKGKDSEITNKYRKIIALCTGVDESRVDESIASLVRSLESEHDDVELGRVREFLSKVEGV